MAEIESAWEKHPGYRIDLVPVKGVARAFLGDLLLAESSAALRVIETDHVERLYFPESDVRFELLEENDHHSVCPFKGEADYWSLVAGSSPVEDVFWSYRHPFEQVAGIVGHLGVYHEKLRVEIESRWDDDPRASSSCAFPAWGDQDDLLRRDAVDDHRVGRGAHHRREAVVAEEVRPRPPLLQDVPGGPVDVEGGDTGPQHGPGRLVDLGHHPAGPAHLGQFVGVAPHRVVAVRDMPVIVGAGSREPSALAVAPVLDGPHDPLGDRLG